MSNPTRIVAGLIIPCPMVYVIWYQLSFFAINGIADGLLHILAKEHCPQYHIAICRDLPHQWAKAKIPPCDGHERVF